MTTINESNEHFPLPEEKVVLLDLDQTCFGTNYELPNETRFYDSVKLIQSAGWLVGINSDTPLKLIKERATEWGLTGPNIAEKGLVVEVDGCIYYDRGKSEIFADTRQKVEEYFTGTEATVWSGDPVSFIRSGKTIGRPGDTAILINSFRLCSLGIFVRRVTNNGTFCIDEALTSKVIDETRKLYPDLEDPDEDIAHDYGLFTLSEKSAEKRKGTIQLQKIKSLGKVAMIGNSMSDYLGSDVATHYAVSNADAGFKKVADYTAKQSLSQGVVEVLDRLIVHAR